MHGVFATGKRVLGAIVSVLLLPFDLLRLTWLCMGLAIRFLGRMYRYYLSGSRVRPPLAFEFLASRPNHKDVVWDDHLRYVVRRALTLRVLSWFCGRKQIPLRNAHPYEEVSCRVELSPKAYVRMGISLGLAWLLAAGGGLLAWQMAVRLPRHRDWAAGYQRDADRLLAQGAFDKARIQYLNVLHLRPGSVEAQWGLAQSAAGLNRWTESRRALEQVIALDRSHREARELLADMLIRQGHAAQAVEHAEWIVAQVPGDVAARVRLGQSQQALGRRREARRQAQAALELDPQHTGALLLAAALAADSGDCAVAQEYLGRANLAAAMGEVNHLAVARILSRCGDYMAAVAQLDMALTHSPGHLAVAQERAELLLAAGEIDGAIQGYRRLSEFAAADAMIQTRLAELLLASGRLDEAHRVGESMIRSVAQRHAGHMVLATVYYLKGLWLAAAEHCQMHLEVTPESVPGRVMLARIQMRQGQYRKAANGLQSLLSNDWRNLEIRLMLAECQVEMGQRRPAIELLRQIIRRAPGLDEPHMLLARLHVADGALDQAEAAYRKALELNPRQTVALNNLAVLLSAGETRDKTVLKEALDVATQAWQLRPDNPEIADTLGRIHALLGDYHPAVSLLSYAARLLPGQAHVHQNLAVALAGLGYMEDAAMRLSRALELAPELAASPEVQQLQERLAHDRAAPRAEP